jgi:HAMP domain-containing protein
VSDDEAEKEVEDCVAEMEIRLLNARVHEIRQAIDEHDRAGAADRLPELQQELGRLRQTIERLREAKLVSARVVGG